MLKIKRGSLVCMGRRSIKGQGLVLNRVRDINEYANFDLSEAFYKLHDRSHPEYFWKKDGADQYSHYAERDDLKYSINDTILSRNPVIDRTLLEEFWNYNRAYSYLKGGNKILKPKTDFCLVWWTKAPSEYTPKAVSGFKGKSLYHHTKMLKNL
mgnify:FL=1|tara:strand:- start:1402 stop:1863 length:462 start_codon:yes stop_codon:yes gene_type:complete